MSKKLANTTLSPEQQSFALQLAINNSVVTAARLAGVSERTGRRWVDLPQVQAYASEIREQAFETAMQLLEISTLSAVSMLNEALNSEHTDNNQKIKAAQILLDRGIEARKMRMLETRLQEMERQVEILNVTREVVVSEQD